jgi:hypothetical protein
MPELQFLKKKIGLSYLIWLQKGNKYLLLEEPAWFVLNKLAKNEAPLAIASVGARRYGNPLEECLSFVENIQSTIEQINQPAPLQNDWGDTMPGLIDYSFNPYSIQKYRFGNMLIQFSYESALFESYLHPLISHLETSETEDNIPFFELFEFDNQIVFRRNGKIKGAWGYDETHLVKGLIFMNLVNVMFDKSDDFWLMTVHASAVTNGKETILISASPGSGKSTMAAMLQKQGYALVSDDFVPVDKYDFRAWPFPIAMSVKEGAVDLLSSIYPGLEQKPIHPITSEKSVRYLFPEKSGQTIPKANPVKAFIFIQYNASVAFEWEKLDKVSAVKQLLDQSWISPSEGTARILLDQISRWSFYRLTYSDNQKALARIEKLFSHD